MTDNKITDNEIKQIFLLDTVDTGNDTNRFERRKFVTQCERKQAGKYYQKKLVNEDAYEYIMNRYSDSSSISETLYRIAKGIEKRPVCKNCGKEVEFQGLTGGFKDFCCSDCRYEYKGKQMRIHPEKEKHAINITEKTHIDDSIIKKVFCENKTAKETASLMNSYIMYEVHNGIVKNNIININIYNYLKNRYSDSESIQETLYRILNNVHERPKCPVCGGKLEFVNVGIGFRKYCSQRCISVLTTEHTQEREEKRKAERIIKKNRTYKETFGKDVDDDAIIKIFYKDKTQDEKDMIRRAYIQQLKSDKVSNIVDVYIDVLDYLVNTRFKDSDSLQESLYRILHHEEEKPRCPICGKPVSFYGKPGKPWNIYCSDKCKLEVAKKNLMKGYNPRSVSVQETGLYEKIKQVFNDAIHNYQDETYPHNCDIYIPSLRLYIEYQGYFSHGNHPYRNNEDDIDYAEFLKYKHGDWAKEYWVVKDVEKRRDAKHAGIRFLELWTKDNGKRRFNEILTGLHRMKGKTDKEVFNIIKEISLYETIYDENIYLGK